MIDKALTDLTKILRTDLCNCGRCKDEESFFQCEQCKQIVPYCYGADDEYFVLCDECAVKAAEAESLGNALSTALGIKESNKEEKNKALIKEALLNGIYLLSLREVIQILQEIAEEKDAKQPYFEWKKDAELLKTLSGYIEN